MDYKTNINFRKETLIKLLNAVIIHENEIIQALYDDFKKPAFEAVITETSYVIQEFIKGDDIGIEAFYSNGQLLNYNAGKVIGYSKSKFTFTTKRNYFLKLMASTGLILVII